MKCFYRLFLWQLYYAYAIADRPQQQRMLTEPLPALWDWIMPFAVEMKGGSSVYDSRDFLCYEFSCL